MKSDDKDITKTFDKVYGVFLRLSAGVSVSFLLLSSLSLFTGMPITLLSTIACLVLGIPTTFIGLTVLRNKIHNSYVKDMHMFEQLTRGIEEFKEDPSVEHTKVLDGMAVFYSFISRKDKNNIIPQSDYNSINAFLFMINENYYEKIAVGNYKCMSRTMIIENIISFIIGETKDNIPFDENVAEKVINRVFFIDEKTKREMINEFKKSKKVVPGVAPLYQIVSSKVSTKSIEEFLDKPKSDSRYGNTLDISNPNDYKRLLKRLSKSEKNKYGDFTEIDFDYETLKEIICMIECFYGKQFKENYPDFDIKLLASTFLYETAIYAKINNKNRVGVQEILNTLKNYHYLDFEDKLHIADAIILNFDSDGINHPFRENPKPKSYGKIIQFPIKENKF